MNTIEATFLSCARFVSYPDAVLLRWHAVQMTRHPGGALFGDGPASELSPKFQTSRRYQASRSVWTCAVAPFQRLSDLQSLVFLQESPSNFTLSEAGPASWPPSGAEIDWL
jgi:hypothetical protein